MNILFFSYLDYDNLDYKGGNWIITLSKFLSKKEEHKVAIAYPSHNNEKNIRDGITYYSISARKTTTDKLQEVLFNKPIYIQHDERVNAIISDFNPTIIQLFGLETEFSRILYHVKNIPVVVHLQGICDPIIERWFPVGLDKSRIKRQYPLRNQIFRNNTTDRYYRTRKIAKIEKQSYEHYHYYLGRTEWDKALCQQFSRRSKYFLCNEILRDVFYKTEWEKSNHSDTIVSVSNGEIYKGFDVILRTAKCLKGYELDFQWKVIGINEDDPLLKIVEKCYGLSFSENNVHFIGKKDANEIASILQTSKVFVHPTHVDNSPNSLCEALIMGVPSVASYVGGIPSLINEGIDGLLFPDGDYLYLASIINSLFSSEDIQSKLSLNGRNRALLRHNPQKIVDNLLENYNLIIEDFNKLNNE